MTPGLRALVIWLAAVALLGGAVAAVQLSAAPLDDRKPAQQRPGYLDAVGARDAGPLVTISRPAPGKITVIFFVRSAQQRPLLRALSKPRALPANVDAFVVGGRPDLTESRFTSISDADAALARGYAMPVPRDGGYPVGYAVVGPDGTIRYRTLDPGMAGRLDEVRTIVAALR